MAQTALIVDFQAATADIVIWPISTVSFYSQTLVIDFYAATADIVSSFSSSRRTASAAENRTFNRPADIRTAASEADL